VEVSRLHDEAIEIVPFMAGAWVVWMLVVVVETDRSRLHDEAIDKIPFMAGAWVVLGEVEDVDDWLRVRAFFFLRNSFLFCSRRWRALLLSLSMLSLVGATTVGILEKNSGTWRTRHAESA